MESQKKIMILGGGYYQLPLIRKSIELGYFTIVCGIEGNYPGYKYATKWYNVDTFDKDACLEIAKKERIDGILTCGTDAMMTTIGYICDKMNLIGPTEESTLYATNKALMKERFLISGVRTACYRKISDISEAESFCKKNGFPVVLKIVDGCGGRGISIIKNKDDLLYYFPIIQAETKESYLIIEEFISGEEFGAQAFVRNGVLSFVMPHGDIVFHGDTDIPIGHYAPFEKEKQVLSDVIEQLNLCIKALGINNTAINADFILCKGMVYVLEVGARAGATCLPELVSCHYNTNYYEYLIKMCVGDPINSFNSNKRTPSSVKILYSTKSGILTDLSIKKMPKEVVSYDFYPKIGDTINSFKNAYDRLGYVVNKGNSIRNAGQSSNYINNSIIITLNHEETEILC